MKFGEAVGYTEKEFDDCPALGRMVLQGMRPYYHDPVGFSYDVLGYTPTFQQAELMEKVAGNSHITVRSGHGIGKSKGIGSLSWWFLCTRPRPVIPCTAPSSHQLYDVLWKELTWCHEQMPGAFSDAFEYSSQRIWLKGDKEKWYLQARTARRDKPEALQGFHGQHMLVLVEEAGGVDDEIFEPVEGALTEEDNRIVLVGNPTRTGGYFYNSHHGSDDAWTRLHFSSEDSPIVKPKFVERMRQRYGEHSSIFRVRVLGEFPHAEPDQLIPIDLAYASVMRETEVLRPIVWGVDVARFGDDESVLAKRHGHRVLPLKSWRNMSTTALARAISSEFERARAFGETPEKIFIDVNGVGAGVYDSMEDKGYPVEPVNASWAASDARYGNLKAEMYFTAKEKMEAGFLSLPDRTAEGQEEIDLIPQMTSVKYMLNGKKQLIIEKKQDMRRRGVVSPDRWEAIAHTFASPVNFTGEDEYGFGKGAVENGYDYDEFSVEV